LYLEIVFIQTASTLFVKLFKRYKWRRWWIKQNITWLSI